MPLTPLPFSGYCYDDDESTLLTGGTVYFQNETKDESSTVSVNASGEYTFDLANLTTQWAVGDIINVYLYNSDDSKVGSLRKIIATGDTSYEINLNCHVLTDMERVIYPAQGRIVTIKTSSYSVDSNGHSFETTTDDTIKVVPQIMSYDSQAVQEGILQVGDLTIFVSPNQIFRNKMIAQNKIVFDGSTYVIKSVVKETGVRLSERWSHYEVHAGRES